MSNMVEISDGRCSQNLPRFLPLVFSFQKSNRLYKKSLKAIYLTSITQKPHRTYKRVLEGADVGVLWSYMVEETGEPGENHRPWTGRPLPCHMRTPGFDLGSQRWQASALTTGCRKPALSVSDHVRHKPGCTSTEDG